MIGPYRNPLEGIEALVGREAALLLAARLGGRYIYIPRRQTLGPNHTLYEVIGITAATTLCDAYAGDSLYIPKARRELARDMHDRGHGFRDIAEKLGITRFTARRYCR